MSTHSEPAESRTDAISALSTLRLLNILASLDHEAASEGRLGTVHALIELPAISQETFPDRNFSYLAKGALGDLSSTGTPREQSDTPQTLELASDGPDRQQTSELREIKAEPDKVNQRPKIEQAEALSDAKKEAEPRLGRDTGTPRTQRERPFHLS
jgi:hypothetical protein